MAELTEAEKQKRRRIVGSTIGTHAMEGLRPDAQTLDILNRYADGELSPEQFSEHMQAHAKTLVAALRPLAGAA